MSSQYAQCERHCDTCDRLEGCERPEAAEERATQSLQIIERHADPLEVLEAQMRGLQSELEDLRAKVVQVTRFRDDLIRWMQHYGRGES